MEFYAWVNFAHRLGCVSIPNGMEFYPMRFLAHFRAAKVSIPNGMEFYTIRKFPRWPAESFNSQRDGILPYHRRRFRRTPAFQFPTGWNSTQLFKKRAKFRRVSIPNGMEFYAMHEAGGKKWAGFNSQRDGILPSRAMQQYIQTYEFQFPTGWNSTFVVCQF